MELINFPTPKKAPEAEPLTPVPELVEFLQQLLARAESGVLRHIVAVGYNADGTTCDGWSAVKKDEGGVRMISVLGALDLTKLRYADAIMDLDDDRQAT